MKLNVSRRKKKGIIKKLEKFVICIIRNN